MNLINMTVDANSDSWALEPKYCVNPYEISTTYHDQTANMELLDENMECPNGTLALGESSRSQSVHNLTSDSYSLVNTSVVKNESFPIVKSCLIKSEVSHSAITSPEPITDLESFQDLTVWCHEAPRTPSMSWQTETDELNTPIIELGELLFTTPTTLDNTSEDCYGLLSVTNSSSPDLYVSTSDTQSNKYNIINSSNSNEYNTDINKSEIYKYFNIHVNENGEGNVIEHSEPIKNIKYTTSDNINNNFTSVQTGYNSTNQQFNLPTITCAKNTATHSLTNSIHQQQNVFTFTHQSPIESRADPANQIATGDVIPPMSTPVAPSNNSPPLKLDFSAIKMENKHMTLDTPEVINTALSMENEFNLINFIINDDVFAEELPIDISTPLHDADEISQSVSISNEPSSISNDPDSDFSCDSTDDEDYEPPWKKSKAPGKKLLKKKSSKSISKPANLFININKRDSFDSEVSNISVTEQTKVVRRGRPPKRNISISSESNVDGGEVSRYRELRDKNNEASRRSRLNRKLKEVQMEDEAKELAVRNQKLKSEVAALEELVNTMRTNLMGMLLKK